MQAIGPMHLAHFRRSSHDALRGIFTNLVASCSGHSDTTARVQLMPAPHHHILKWIEAGPPTYWPLAQATSRLLLSVVWFCLELLSAFCCTLLGLQTDGLPCESEVGVHL